MGRSRGGATGRLCQCRDTPSTGVYTSSVGPLAGPTRYPGKGAVQGGQASTVRASIECNAFVTHALEAAKHASEFCPVLHLAGIKHSSEPSGSLLGSLARSCGWFGTERELASGQHISICVEQFAISACRSRRYIDRNVNRTARSSSLGGARGANQNKPALLLASRRV